MSLVIVAGITFFSQSFHSKIKGVHQITILHTNDHHGHFWETENDEWGMAARATLVKQIRQEVSQRGGSVLLLSGGDINTGTPESDMSDAFPDFIGMRYMKYDAMAIGNHEFDNHLDVIFNQQAMAGFPFLSANLYYKGTDRRPFSPYKIMEVAGLRVGILGLTTDESPQISLMFPKETLELKSPISEAKKLVPELKNKVDLLIAVTHMGHYKDGQHGSSAPGDVTLARTVKGIDVIVGGHSQNPLFQPDLQNGTFILQAQDFGKYLGRVDIEVSQNQTHLSRNDLLRLF